MTARARPRSISRTLPLAMTTPQPDERWVRIRTMQDPVQARALRELLAREGIPCATPGAEHRAALGFIGAYVSIPVQVPEAHREEAKRLYDAFIRPGIESGAPAVDAGGASAADDAPSGPSRLRRVAVFVAIWAGGIGAGHLYARESAAALVLFLAQVAALLGTCAGGPPSLAVGGVLVWAYDVIGSVPAVDRHNRGRMRTPTTSAAITVVAVLVLQALAVPLTQALETYVPPPRPASPFRPEPAREGGPGTPSGLPITDPF